MVKEERLKSKYLYKVFLTILKYIPYILALCYIANTFHCYFGTDLSVLSNIAGVSLLTWLFLYISTFVFNFCACHRLPLYFILTSDLLNIYDYYIGIPISTYSIISIHFLLSGVLILLIIIYHVKYHKRTSEENN